MISFIGAGSFMLDIICALTGHGFAVYVGEFGMFGGAEHLIDQGLHQFFSEGGFIHVDGGERRGAVFAAR